MISEKALKYFKDNGYSFEEIEGIKNGKKQSAKGLTISKSEMKKFAGEKLFSKYTNNV